MRSKWLPLLLAVAALGLAACGSGAYPLDFFNEMHFQQSQRRGEPPRLAAPRDSVPVTGARVPTTWDEAATLQNPLPPSDQTRQQGLQVYARNCAACHGRGDGQGPMASYFTAAGFVGPVAFDSQRVRDRTDGQLYWLISYGIGSMPAFSTLLTEQDIWASVFTVRQLGGT